MIVFVCLPEYSLKQNCLKYFFNKQFDCNYSNSLIRVVINVIYERFENMAYSNYFYQFVNRINAKDIGLFIFSILVIGLFVTVIRRFSRWLSIRFPGQRMRVFAWVPVVNFSLYFIGILLSFYIIFHPRYELLIAVMMSGLIAFGFAVKDIVTSIIGGIVLLVDKPFQLGDRITFENYYGEVVQVGLRSTKLLTLDDSVVTIPNHRFLANVVSSSSAGDRRMMVVVDIYVSLDVDLHTIKNILQEESQKSHYVDPKEKAIIVGKEVLGVNGIVSVMLTVKCIIKDARFEQAFQTDLLLDVIKRFKTESVL